MNVATLPCEIRNSKNIILQWDITKENCIKRIIICFIEMDLIIKFGVLLHQCVYGTKICDIYDLQKCLTQIWVDFEQNVIEAAIEQWHDSLRSRVHVGGGNFEHMLRNYCLFALCGSSEHFMKLSI